MTKQEKHLWYDFLAEYPVKFLRQKIVDSYIVDFYCSKARLAVELDGAQHYTEHAKGYDAVRTQLLASARIEVIRFPNADIDYRFEAVCDEIDRIVRERVELFEKEKPEDTSLPL